MGTFDDRRCGSTGNSTFSTAESPRKEMKLLHDQSDIGGAEAVTATFGECGNIFAIPTDATFANPLQSGDEVDEGTFAGARGAGNHDTAAGSNR